MGKKVIGFSLWGEQEHYYQGALENISLAKKYYPEWECWFYIAPPDHPGFPANVTSLIKEIESKSKVIFFDQQYVFDGMFMRFKPVIDLEVEFFISRDCDSRLNSRERAAVDEWIESGLLFHIMRDHKDHLTHILGGMWGCRCKVLRDLQKMLNQWRKFDNKGDDQLFLTEYVWPRIKNNHLAHDDAYDYSIEPARSYPWAGYGKVKHFPKHEPMEHGTFVGEQFF